MDHHTRRRFLMTSAFAAASLTKMSDAAHAQLSLSPTPACDDGGAPTLRQTEGPYFRPQSPQRSDLREPGLAGQPVELSGLVLTRSCKPVPRALLDLWHADDAGDYDNAGYKFRGHVFSDAEGRYQFRTIVPGVYPGRTRHYHIKVQAPGERVLTTQLYFPGETDNRRDGLFRPELLLRTARTQGTLASRFDFVLDLR